MKIDTKQESALVIGGETTQFGLNLEDPGIFVQMLLNLYSDPISSSVREYLSNALDANKEVSSTQPIVVGLTKDKFFVQDYGRGISPDFMNDGYCTIGYSTKRDCDQMIGAYGFGRLTFLSYVRDTTKQYWVHTVYEGVGYEYLIFLDGNTIKQTLISQSPTDEPSGTRVVVQLKKEWNEFAKWNEAIKQQCAYFEGTVIDIEGQRQVVEVKKDGIIRGSNLYKDDSHLVLGSVYYDIDWDHFKGWEMISNLGFGIHIGLDEGIIPVPSRESIVYDKYSIQVIENKFKTILEDIWEQCNKELREIESKSRIERLSFLYDPKLSLCNYHQYKNICTLINRPPIEIEVDSRIKRYTSAVWCSLKNSFKGVGVYCQNWTPLRREYIKSLGLSCAERTNVKFELYSIITIPQADRETLANQANQLKQELLNEWVDLYYTKFDEVGFLEWKKNRKPEKRVKRGMVYYRESLRNCFECTQERGDIDISTYRYMFKASEPIAKRYWRFLNKTFKNFIITKEFGYDMDKLEPSPLLRRMCTEALKARVYNILGYRTNDKTFKTIIGELNPLLKQYMDEVGLYERNFEPEQEALIEVGEKFNCFDKDEVKLRFIEHHLKLLKFAKYVGSSESWREIKFKEEEIRLIKRHYILERLAEKKWKQEPVDTNQLEIQFN